uniref:GIYYIG endonuclease n=1 Tax=Rhizophagus irregularis TaxID=588596 RepID=S4TD57_9GLOM|nr:GIYYIG endonuclease [Rhizophagus irregularis]
MISKNLIRTTIEQSEKEILDFRDLINDQANLSIFFMKLWQIKDLYPKFTQYNPFTQKTLLLQELKNLAGIYCWYNITRDLFYIGSSNNLRQRMTCYLSLAYLTSHQDYSIINRALLKYGFSGT